MSRRDGAMPPAHHTYLVRVGGRGLTHVAGKVDGKIILTPACGARAERWHVLPGGVVVTCRQCKAIRAAVYGKAAQHARRMAQKISLDKV